MNLKEYLNKFKISNKSYDHCDVYFSEFQLWMIFHKWFKKSKTVLLVQSYIGLNNSTNDGSFIILFKNYFKLNENNEYTDNENNGLAIKIKKQ
jgi:hypothetical protein